MPTTRFIRVKTAIVPSIQALFPGATNALVKLYRALEFENQRQVRWAPFVRSAATRAAERYGDLIVTLECAERMEVDSRLPIPTDLAPFLQRENCRCEHHAPVNVQKLVDSMIVADTIFYGAFANFGVIVVSDDVDMSPGLVMGADQRSLVGGVPSTSLAWLRPGGGTSFDERFRDLFMVIGGTL